MVSSDKRKTKAGTLKSKVSSHRWEKAQIAEEKHQRGKRLTPEGLRDCYTRTFGWDDEFFRNKICVEVGCGITGPIHYIDGPSIRIGVDPLCLKCLDLYDKQALSVPHVVGTGEYLPIRDGVIDVVIFVGVLEHCLNPEVVLEEIHRTLRKGGCVFLTLLVFNKIPRLVRNSLLRLVDKPHPYHFSQLEVVEMLKQAGFTIRISQSNTYTFAEWLRTRRQYTFISSLKALIATLLGLKELFLILTK